MGNIFYNILYMVTFLLKYKTDIELSCKFDNEPFQMKDSANLLIFPQIFNAISIQVFKLNWYCQLGFDLVHPVLFNLKIKNVL